MRFVLGMGNGDCHRRSHHLRIDLQLADFITTTLLDYTCKTSTRLPFCGCSSCSEVLHPGESENFMAAPCGSQYYLWEWSGKKKGRPQIEARLSLLRQSPFSVLLSSSASTSTPRALPRSHSPPTIAEDGGPKGGRTRPEGRIRGLARSLAVSLGPFSRFGLRSHDARPERSVLHARSPPRQSSLSTPLRTDADRRSHGDTDLCSCWWLAR